MRLFRDFAEFTSGGGICKKIATVLCNPCFHSVVLYRLSSLFYRLHLTILSKIIWYINRMVFHVDIDYRADLAGGFVLVHGIGTVIGKGVCSQGSLTVYQGVCLGGNGGRQRVDGNGRIWTQPLIGNNVKIYTGAYVFGPVIISDNSSIKAGSITVHDI